jgi:hypothetical protein
MSHHEKVLMIAALLLAHGAVAEASLVTETNPSNVSVFINQANEYTFSFAPIANADELISISDGSIFNPEGGTLTLEIDYVGGIHQPIATLSGNFIPLSAFSLVSFAPGTINGITFHYVGGLSIAGNLMIPAGTVFTFDAVVSSVPEPSSLALALAAGSAGLLNWRRRRIRPTDQPTTSE